MSTRSRAALAAATVLVVAACGGDDSANGEATGVDGAPVIDGTFTTTIPADPGSLDPHMTVLSLTRSVASYMYDTLLFMGDDGEVEPFLAESWEVDIDEVTFTLAEGITCSDDTPLTASTVAANFEFVADPENGSPLLGLFVQPGLTATSDDDAGTVTLTAAQPDPFLLQASGQLHIVCDAGLTDRSQLEAGSVGTGMFTLVDAVAEGHYTFERRDEYAWGPGGAAASDAGTPAEVNLQVVANEATAVNMFLANDIDAVVVNGADVERIPEDVHSYDTAALYGELFFNQGGDRPGADPAVRTALAQAGDFEAVGMVMTGGRGQPAESLGILEPRVCQADTVTGSLPAHDQQAAADALDAAGWVAGADGTRSKDGEPLTLSLLYLTEFGPEMAAGAELLAQQWAEVGVDVTLQGITTPQLNEIIFGTGEWDAGFIRLNVSFPTQLIPFLSGPTPTDGTNFAHIANDEYDAAVAAASGLPAEEGCEHWEASDRAIVANADLLPFVDAVTPLFINNVEMRLQAGSISPSTIRLYE
jgi:peptide/nickel transport system substrate-binding protein